MHKRKIAQHFAVLVISAGGYANGESIANMWYVRAAAKDVGGNKLMH
jgi:NAD(P)H-dependent flavin oxidoreductase YrpB (nitropropane dioxygenase family)